MAQWYCMIRGQQYGPVPEGDIRQWITDGRVQGSDYVWHEGLPNWLPARDTELMGGAAPSSQPGGGGGAPPPFASAPYQSPHITRSRYRPVGPKDSAGAGIAGMVLGILAVVLWCIWFLSIPCAVIGLVLSGVAVGRRRSNRGRGMGIAGLVLSIVALALWCVFAILFAIGAMSPFSYEPSRW